MRSARRAALPVGLMLLAACGGGGEDAAAEVAPLTALASQVVVAADRPAICGTLFAEDFVRAVFGSLQTCVDTGYDPGGTATGASVTDVRLDGDTATATVTEQGGPSGGAAGTWGFVRTDAGWQVAEWRTDYLRAMFRAQLGPAYQPDGADDPLRNARVRSCVSDRFQGLADPEFRATAYEIFRTSAAGGDAVRRWYQGCTAGVSALRLDFEDVLRQAGVPTAVVDCTVKKLRRSVSDAEIRAMGESGAADPPPGVRKRIEKATGECVESTAELDSGPRTG